MEYGRYEYGYKIIHSSKIPSAEERILTFIHEGTHQHLSQSTIYGAIMELLHLISFDPSTNKQTANEFKILYKKLLKHCLKLQEFAAIFTELNSANRLGNNIFENTRSLYMSDKNYNKLCRFDKRKWIFNYPIEIISCIIFDIAIFAMNIDIKKVNILDKKIDKILINNDLITSINPNCRFFIMLDALEKILANEKPELYLTLKTHSEIDNYVINLKNKIIESVHINHIIMSEFNLETWYEENILTQFKLLPFIEYIELKSNVSPEELFDIIEDSTIRL